MILSDKIPGKRDTKAFKTLPYNPELKPVAAALRKAGNLAEVLFWHEVKNGGLKGLDFDRQKIIGNYIVDFYCAEKQLVIEIDGSSHNDKLEYDKNRDTYFISLGLKVLHFADTEILKNLDMVIMYLSEHSYLK